MKLSLKKLDQLVVPQLGIKELIVLRYLSKSLNCVVEQVLKFSVLKKASVLATDEINQDYQLQVISELQRQIQESCMIYLEYRMVCRFNKANQIKGVLLKQVVDPKKVQISYQFKKVNYLACFERVGVDEVILSSQESLDISQAGAHLYVQHNNRVYLKRMRGYIFLDIQSLQPKEALAYLRRFDPSTHDLEMSDLPQRVNHPPLEPLVQLWSNFRNLHLRVTLNNISQISLYSQLIARLENLGAVDLKYKFSMNRPRNELDQHRNEEDRFDDQEGRANLANQEFQDNTVNQENQDWYMLKCLIPKKRFLAVRSLEMNLRIMMANQSLTNAVLESVQDFSNLQELRIFNKSYSQSETYVSLSQLSSLLKTLRKSLRVLECPVNILGASKQFLRQVEIFRDSVSALTALEDLRLDFSGASPLDDTWIAEFVGSMPARRLTRLDLSYKQPKQQLEEALHLLGEKLLRLKNLSEFKLGLKRSALLASSLSQLLRKINEHPNLYRLRLEMTVERMISSEGEKNFPARNRLHEFSVVLSAKGNNLDQLNSMLQDFILSHKRSLHVLRYQLDGNIDKSSKPDDFFHQNSLCAHKLPR